MLQERFAYLAVQQMAADCCCKWPAFSDFGNGFTGKKKALGGGAKLKLERFCTISARLRALTRRGLPLPDLSGFTNQKTSFQGLFWAPAMKKLYAGEWQDVAHKNW